jgi:lantibiotic biosynthesis protein
LPKLNLYEPLKSGLVRLPLGPVEVYPRNWSTLGEHSPFPADGTTRTAVAVASPDLFRALGSDRLNERQAARARRRLHRYMIRMVSRPTPYGLFAGVGVVSWGSMTDLGVASSEVKTQTRPDMAWLLGLVDDLEQDISVRRGVRLLASSAYVVRGRRLFVASSAPSPTAGLTEGNSVRATAAALDVLDLARSPIAYEELTACIVSRTNATLAEAESVIAQLLKVGALVSDLRPPLTGSDPAGYVTQRLAAMPAAAATRDALEQVLTAIAEWDALPTGERCDSLPLIASQMRALHCVSPSSTLLHVDTALDLAGRAIHSSVACEAAKAAELLLRISPWPHGLPYLAAYVARFIERYGPKREVPLLELLEPELGLGPPDPTQGGANGAARPQRSQALQAVALGAQRDPSRVVELDDGLLDRLQTWEPEADTAPLSLDLAVFLAARSAPEVDRGEYQLVLSPNVGATAAGRNAGRFAQLLGRDGTALLTQIADAEAERLDHVMWTEVVYIPAERRSANVVIRPVVRPHEIVLGTMPGVSDDRVIPLDELMVGIRDERFYVRWPRCDAELRVVQGHMLNSVYAPPVVRFLLDVAADRGVQLSHFDWGPAAAFPFLPRVKRGRVVLSSAQWRVSRGAAAETLAPNPVERFSEALDGWRARWSVPRYVYLTVADNRLLLDLDDAACIELLRDELARLADDGSLLLQEALPGLGDAWVEGPNGRHIVELVVSLVLRARRRPGADTSGALSRHRASRSHSQQTHPVGTLSTPNDARVRPPGSDWLYLKLYCPPAAQDDLIGGALREFTQILPRAGMSDCWFFVRYADPLPHLRVRFHGNPDMLVSTLLPQLSRWANDLVLDGVCERFAFDTYERELERYGGNDGTSLAEAIFTVDSIAVAELLQWMATHSDPPDRLTLAILSVDDMLASLGFDERARHEFYLARATLSAEDGQEYRKRKTTLARLFESANGGPPDGADPEIARILAARHRDLNPVASELAILEDQGILPTPRTVLYANYVHMHCNRLGTGPALEQQALQLLRRTRESLRARARS